MTSTLLWMMYLADVVGSIGFVCALTLVLCGLWVVGVGIFLGPDIADGDYKDGAVWRLAKIPLLAIAVSAAVGTFTPSKTTIYAGAAALVGERVAETEEFQMVRELLKQELRKLTEKKEK
jgi:hypothetical protein